MKIALLLLWTLVIVGVTTLPWSDYTGHSHWDHVRWVPFSERPLITTDVLLNVILFVPFGFLLMRAGATARSAKRAASVLLLAATLSILAEYFQVYCHNRIPSVTDVCTNILGAGLGVSFHWRRERQSKGGFAGGG
jgi:glycopeptide antibiotics resistance protein